ncbi:MAG TPA: RNA 2',3'-cyclic phosphodiesterase [Verrucomicrobiae bacterium]|nr:RNA 2',3'-cyclic phosphodiesterase [Verrucomicrobiae bacterium]
MRRLFFALPLAEYFEGPTEAYMARLQAKSRGMKWCVPSQIHATLHFFGPVPDEDYPKIKTLGAAEAQKMRPLKIAMEGLGFFPDERRPRVVWLGLKGELEPLAAFQARIEASLKAAGFPVEERAFRPHATIARVKNIAEFRLEPRVDFPATAEAVIGHMVLYESHSSGTGPVYEAVEKFPFAA